MAETEVKQFPEIVLMDHQIEHFSAVSMILQKLFFYVDTSAQGSGKTFVAMKVAKTLGMRVFVVCPSSVVPGWIAYLKEYGVDYYDVVTYESLRGTSGRQPSNGWLIRSETPSADPLSTKKEPTVDFACSERMKFVIKEAEHGTFFIFDEVHKLKNVSQVNKACTAITREIISTLGKARFALLSHTPFDKEELVINMIKFLGFTTYQKLHMTTKEGVVKMLGLEDIIRICRYLDDAATEEALTEIPLTDANIKKFAKTIVFNLYYSVISPNTGSAMTQIIRPVLEDGTVIQFDVKNGFYRVTDAHDLSYIQAGLAGLKSAITYDGNAADGVIKKVDYGAVSKSLETYEYGMVNTFIRLAVQHLTCKPKGKVVIGLNYIKIGNVQRVATALAAYGVLVYTGEVKSKLRGEYVDLFQNNPGYRVFVGTTVTAAFGVNLDDQIGDSERLMLISSDHYIIKLQQMTYRIFRAKSRSNATVRFVYPDGGLENISVLNSLCKKSVVLKKAIHRKAVGTTILPIDYPSYYEASNIN